MVYEGSPGSDPKLLIDWMQQNKSEWTKDLNNSGAILFRNFSFSSPKEFQEFLLSTKEPLGEFYLGTSPRDQIVQYVFTASELPPHYPIMQHAEMSFLDNPPKYLFFFAERASERDGETPITDLRTIWEEMPNEIRDKVLKHGIKYRRRYDGPAQKKRYSLWKTKRWDEMFGTVDKTEVKKISDQNRFQLHWQGDDQLTIVNHQDGIRQHPTTKTTAWHNHSQTFHFQAAVSEVWSIFKRQKSIRSFSVALLLTILTGIKRLLGPESHDVHVTYGNGEEISTKDMKLISNLFWKHMKIFSWRTGDILMIDNYSVSHGRLPFKGPRRILVGWANS
ncbi:taurine catabolism dioxygenase, TauD/TfdA family [Leptospira ryugenii]|uniref:Taurine catabolism dioxygenase, TauD/TfdA family n=2 Tax=Leptospira ryugenii TaxID=1917863 RepID=A0A2P2DZP6_9LEPT|nr:taurine catabolism dioxygenase, TauD/TfdA family [Leptospira ryugenii]